MIAALAALALGALAATGFAPLTLWPLSLIALAGLMLLLDGAPRPRAALGLGWLFGLAHYSIGFDWIATAFTYQAAMPPMLGWGAVLGVAGLMAVYPALAAYGAHQLGRGLPARGLWLAALWMLGEWLRGHLLSGFAWNPLGAIFAGVAPLRQGAALAGAIGLSGLALLAGLSLALLWRRPPGWARVTALAPLMIAGLLAHSTLQAPLPPSLPAKLALVQPDIGQGERYSDPAANLARYVQQTDRAFAQGARVVIWPEGAMPYTIDEEPVLRAALAARMPPGALLLFGADHIERDAQGVARGARNSLYALDSAGRLLARYDKAHLVPGGEYLPLRSLAEPLGLARLVPGSLDFWPGPGPRTLHLPGLPPMGVQICYEIIFPARVIDAGDRPGWLLTVSNDAWFGADGPPQHYAQAQLRAAEEGVPIVRATPNGISGVIDARGASVASLKRHAAAELHADLPAALPPTPFARWGHLTTLLFGLLLAGVALWDRKRASGGQA